MSNFASKLGLIGPKWDKSGTFKDQFPYIFTSLDPVRYGIWIILDYTSYSPFRFGDFICRGGDTFFLLADNEFYTTL